MSKKDWRNLVTAYRHYCILLETIQDFYPGKGGLYVITEKRELLLLDAAQRTIDRMIQTHAAFQTAKIQHSNDLESAEELQAVLQLNKTLLPRWKEQSLNRYPTNFARLLETADAFETLAARS